MKFTDVQVELQSVQTIALRMGILQKNYINGSKQSLEKALQLYLFVEESSDVCICLRTQNDKNGLKFLVSLERIGNHNFHPVPIIPTDVKGIVEFDSDGLNDKWGSLSSSNLMEIHRFARYVYSLTKGNTSITEICVKSLIIIPYTIIM